MTRPADNALRYSPGDDGHVESYFMRGNSPDRRQAFWLKATVFAPRPDSAVAELWCIFFDAEEKRYFSEKQTVPFELASFTGNPMQIALADATFDLSAEGGARGSLHGQGSPAKWDVLWSPVDGPLGERLRLFPSEKLVDAPIPKNTPLTPFPLLDLSGTFQVFDETIDIDGWHGMQGHNWGNEHAWSYAWGHCPFFDDQDEPVALMEGFSASARIAKRPTPIISNLVVRRGDREYRFDRLVDLWRQDPQIDLQNYRWELRLRGPDGEAALAMEADPDEMVCLGYHNPDGRLSYCLNSKLAHTELRLNPVNDAAFECTNPHGGALEFLRNSPDPHFHRVV